MLLVVGGRHPKAFGAMNTGGPAPDFRAFHGGSNAPQFALGARLVTGAPAFQCYARDVYTGTADLSPAEFGTYWRGICWSWDNGPLPDDPARLARILMCAPEEFAVIWPVIVRLFVRTDTGFVNTRLEVVRANLTEFRALKSKAGRASGRKRRHLSAEQNVNTTRTEAERNTNPPISDLRSPISDLRSPINPLSARAPRSLVEPPSFGAFWRAYPKKRGKGQALKAWAKLAPPIDAVLKALEWQVNQHDWLREGGQFIPHPSSWLNARGWEDEPFHAPAYAGPSPHGRASKTLAAAREVIERQLATQPPQGIADGTKR